MNNAEYSFTLDLQSVQSQITLEVNSGDTARRLLIVLTNGGKTHKLANGSMAVISAKKSNGKYLFNKCSIVNDNTTIQYDFTKATTDTPGIMQCEILIADPTEKSIISPRFTMVVDNLINDDVFSEDENNFIVQAVADERTRKDNEETREANEEARQEAEARRNLALKGIELKVATLEAAATNNINQTVEAEYTSPSVQITDEVLPYGIISRIDAGTKRIEIGMPYDITGARGYRTYSQSFPKSDSVVLVKGSKYGALIPCALPSGTIVTVSANATNAAKETVAKYEFKMNVTTSGDSSAVGGNSTNLGKSATLVSNGTHVLITKSNATTALTADLEISDIKVIVNDPDVATIYNPLTIEIPDALTAYLKGNYAKYDSLGNYIDLTTRTFHYYYNGDTEETPQVVDVSEYLEERMDVVSLKPGCIIRTIGADGEPHSGKYTLAYKTKIGG